MRLYRTPVLDFIFFHFGCEGLLSFDCLGQREIKGSHSGSSTISGSQRCPETDFFQNDASMWGAPPLRSEGLFMISIIAAVFLPRPSFHIAELRQFTSVQNFTKSVEESFHRECLCCDPFHTLLPVAPSIQDTKNLILEALGSYFLRCHGFHCCLCC